MTLTPASLRLDLKCGKGAISEGEKCTKGAAQRVQPKKGPRNYAKEIEEQKKIMQANDFSSWRKANKLRKPTTQGAFDKQSKQYAASKQGATLSAAWKKQNKLKKKRTRRNMGYALLGGAAAGLAAMTLAAQAKRSDAAGVPCGESHIPRGRTCHKKGGGFPTRTAVAAGLTAAALGAGAFAYSRRRTRIQPVKVTVLPHIPGSTERGAPRLPGSRDPDMPLLPGITPRALLMPARKRKSKTQRMRENTAAAVTAAEQRIAQTAKEEVRRLGQIGNTMAAAGEAAGMSTKLTARNLRLRVEAARRKYEPGYRRPDQKRLPEGEQPRLTPGSVTPQRVPLPIDPRTGQPRRRRARGFGRADAADKKTIFANKKLHAAVKAEAKRKFKIYPSAYANAWMVREYKKRGGTFRNDALDKWFKEKWVRMSSSGRILGPCGDRSEGEGKPKCLPAAKAMALSPSERRRLVSRKRRKDPRKERSGSPVMVSSKTDTWAVGFDTEDGKKYSKKVRNPKTGRTRTVRYGAKGYKIAPGTDKGDKYCSRSLGQMRKHNMQCNNKDKNTPLCLSRAKWRCVGAKSK